MPVHSPRFSVLVAGFSGVVLFMAGAIWVSNSVPQINAAPEYDLRIKNVVSMSSATACIEISGVALAFTAFRFHSSYHRATSRRGEQLIWARAARSASQASVCLREKMCSDKLMPR